MLAYLTVSSPPLAVHLPLDLHFSRCIPLDGHFSPCFSPPFPTPPPRFRPFPLHQAVRICVDFQSRELEALKLLVNLVHQSPDCRRWLEQQVDGDAWFLPMQGSSSSRDGLFGCFSVCFLSPGHPSHSATND